MNENELKKLIKLVEESNIDELEVSRWGRKVRITKHKASGNPVAARPESPAVHEITRSEPEQAPKKKEEASSDLVKVTSPMVGTFYRSPAPDAKPYVEENQFITTGQVLCIIEAMKLMNEIEAEISGKIVKIAVENAQPVEYGQTLFLVDPNA
ncbi:MAG: acetyl-CoA carboxylase biotin carboxyl carrier protein [candidate division Zixibacteria bacterium]|nr:acetyl-CoA carboxylase biotin carboxyl carrier protein [candidate division Zixibacteria bacterium]